MSLAHCCTSCSHVAFGWFGQNSSKCGRVEFHRIPFKYTLSGSNLGINPPFSLALVCLWLNNSCCSILCYTLSWMQNQCVAIEINTKAQVSPYPYAMITCNFSIKNMQRIQYPSASKYLCMTNGEGSLALEGESYQQYKYSHWQMWHK